MGNGCPRWHVHHWKNKIEMRCSTFQADTQPIFLEELITKLNKICHNRGTSELENTRTQLHRPAELCYKSRASFCMAFVAAACTHEMTPIRTFLKTVDMCPRKESGIVKPHLQTKKKIVVISVIETHMMHVAAKNQRRTTKLKTKQPKKRQQKKKNKNNTKNN